LEATVEEGDQETPATVNLAVAILEVRTSGQAGGGFGLGPLKSSGCFGGAGAAEVASSPWSTPLIAVLTTLGETGRAMSAEANETAGRATKAGVSATARTAEISLISVV
jgi:hypothetical protein